MQASPATIVPYMLKTDPDSTILQKSMQHMDRKDGASVRPKVSSLEKAIRDLEKKVAECK